MFSFTTIQTIVQLFRLVFNILILWMLLYYGVRIVRNNARTSQIFKGIVFILILRAAADFLGLTAVSWLAGLLVTWGPLAIIIIFQPEIRSLLERLGKTSVFSRLSTLSGNERMKLVDALVEATENMVNSHIGGLITIEQGTSLSNYIATGTQMNALVSADLIESLFVPTTPLHDGAVIIQGDRIACASAYFPPTTMDLPSKIGARHRAAIGISEITDSITIVVSEKSGHISIAEKGELFSIKHAELRTFLEKAIILDLPEVDHTKAIKPRTTMTVLSVNPDKKPRFGKRAKAAAQETQASQQAPESLTQQFEKLDLEYSVADESLLEEAPKDKSEEQ